MGVPPWLEGLLKTGFFNICWSHGDGGRSECNMFCLDCNGGAFCFYCRSSKHRDHRVIQIRRSSYHDVVRVSEMEKVLDISGVQTYVINSARVLFLNQRPLPNPRAFKPSSLSHLFQICRRSLLDTFLFCSLACQVVPTHEMECDELVEEARSLPDSKEQVQSEEFCTLMRKQKYVNNMTKHALKKNQPLIILNLMHEKTTLSPAEELTSSQKTETMCLQALCICPFPDLPAAEISKAYENLEALSNKSSSTPPATVASIPDSDLPQIISIISSCPYGITKIVDSLHSK